MTKTIVIDKLNVQREKWDFEQIVEDMYAI